MSVVSGSRQHGSPLPLRGLQLLGLGMITALSAGCMATAAPSAPEPVQRERYQFSSDGLTWGGAKVIPWDQATIPVPGGTPNATSFHLRVDGRSDVEGEVYLGNWSIDRGSAWFRVDVNDVEGRTQILPGAQAPGPGVLMSEFALDAGETVRLTLNVGVPASEVEQAATITPDWGITLHERPGGGGGSGSTGSSGSLGSSGSTGPLGSATGSGSVKSGSTGSSGSSGSSASSGTGSLPASWIGVGSLGSPSLGFG